MAGEKKPTFEELLESVPSGGGGKKLVGVPEGFVAASGSPAVFDEQLLWEPGGWGVELRTTLQAALQAAGLLDEDVTPGVWGEKERDAWKELLTIGNTAGHADYAQTIDEMIQLNQQNPQKAKARRAALVNPIDVEEVGRDVGPRTIGRRPTQGELGSLTAGFNAAASSESTAPPSLANFIENTLRTQNPKEAEEMDMLGHANTFFDLLRSAGG